MDTRLKRNIWMLYIFSFFWLAMLIISVIVPFFESRGLTLAQVFYLQAIFALVMVLFEVPSGYVADVLGRKNALVAGSLFHGLGFTWMCFAQGFGELVWAEVALGISGSLVSGSDLSLLYDSQQALGQSVQERARGIANMRFVKSVAEGVAALLGGVLVLHSMDTTLYANAMVAWIPLFIAVLLVEAPFTRMDGNQHIANLKRVVSHLLLTDRLLALICATMTLYSLLTFLVVWMLQPYWMNHGIPLAGLGFMWAAQSFVFAAATRFCLGLEARYGARPVLVVMALLPVAGYFGMGTFGGVSGILFSFCFSVSRGLNLVLLTDALNRRVPSEFRSTANSMVSLMFRAAYIITGPLLGFVVGWLGIPAALGVLGLVASVSFVALMLPMLAEIRLFESRAPVG